jgi:hypothetical protein
MAAFDFSDANEDTYFNWCLYASRHAPIATSAYEVAKRKHLLNAEFRWLLLETVAEESGCWTMMYPYQAWCVKDTNDFEENYEGGGATFYEQWVQMKMLCEEETHPECPLKRVNVGNGRYYFDKWADTRLYREYPNQLPRNEMLCQAIKKSVGDCEMMIFGYACGRKDSREITAEDLEFEGVSFAYAFFFCRYDGEKELNEELYENENGNLVE